MGAGVAGIVAGVVAATSVWIAPGSALDREVRAGLTRERPVITFVATSSAATLGLRIDTSTTGWVATWTREGTVSEARALGDDAEAATRLAVLLTVERLDEAERAPAPAVEAPDALDVPGDAPRIFDASVATAREEEAAPPRGPWRVEAGASALAWTTPFSARPALSIAAGHRSGRFYAGARAIGAGLCCSIRGDGITAETTVLAALAEGRFAIVDATTALWLVAGAGVAHETLDAEVAGLFAGETAPETTSTTGLLARAGLTVELPIGETLRPSITAGVFTHAASLSAQLPTFYTADKSPIRRGFVVPFVELSASWSLP